MSKRVRLVLDLVVSELDEDQLADLIRDLPKQIATDYRPWVEDAYLLGPQTTAEAIKRGEVPDFDAGAMTEEGIRAMFEDEPDYVADFFVNLEARLAEVERRLAEAIALTAEGLTAHTERLGRLEGLPAGARHLHAVPVPDDEIVAQAAHPAGRAVTKGGEPGPVSKVLGEIFAEALKDAWANRQEGGQPPSKE